MVNQSRPALALRCSTVLHCLSISMGSNGHWLAFEASSGFLIELQFTHLELVEDVLWKYKPQWTVPCVSVSRWCKQQCSGFLNLHQGPRTLELNGCNRVMWETQSVLCWSVLGFSRNTAVHVGSVLLKVPVSTMSSMLACVGYILQNVCVKWRLKQLKATLRDCSSFKSISMFFSIPTCISNMLSSLCAAVLWGAKIFLRLKWTLRSSDLIGSKVSRSLEINIQLCFVGEIRPLSILDV